MPRGIDILVVAFHAKKELAQTLCSLAMWSAPGYKLTVYDNAPINYSLTWLWNKFIQESTMDMIALVNSDVIVSPGWDSESIALLEQHNECSVSMPVSNYNFHSGLAEVPNPTADWPEEVPKLTEKLKLNPQRFHISADHTFVSGHCMLVRKSSWEKLGGFNECFPFLNNDWDFNRRSIEAGMKLGICLHTASQHWWNASTNDAKAKGVFSGGQNFVTPKPGVKFSSI